MNLDPVPMECAKCKKETTHTVTFTEHAKAAGTLSAVCSVCGNAITMPLTGMGRRSSISELVKSIGAAGSYKKKIVKGDF
jgi:thymidine kinase